MLVRRERPEDVANVARVHDAAFRHPDTPAGGPQEVRLLADLRSCGDWIPALSLVAEDGGTIVGHVVCSRAQVAGRYPVLGLGPVGVLPDRQGRGVGTALLHTVIGAADAMDESLIALLGEIAYYARFGFVPAHQLGIESPDPGWGDFFQARVLTAHRPEVRGPFRYAQPFARL